MNNYPELGHIGFKILCTIYGFTSIQYMYATVEQRYKKISLLQEQNTNLQKLLHEQYRKCS